MNNRWVKRESEGSVWYDCLEHDWSFGGLEDDTCPVCFGEGLTEARIIKLLEEHQPDSVLKTWTEFDGLSTERLIDCCACGNEDDYALHLIALIKGQKDNETVGLSANKTEASNHKCCAICVNAKKIGFYVQLNGKCCCADKPGTNNG